MNKKKKISNHEIASFKINGKEFANEAKFIDLTLSPSEVDEKYEAIKKAYDEDMAERWYTFRLRDQKVYERMNNLKNQIIIENLQKCFNCKYSKAVFNTTPESGELVPVDLKCELGATLDEMINNARCLIIE